MSVTYMARVAARSETADRYADLARREGRARLCAMRARSRGDYHAMHAWEKLAAILADSRARIRARE